MKITDVSVVRANRSVFCKILTDEGITGLGESGSWGFLEASAAAILVMRDYLIGKNPLDIEHHWQYLYRFSHFRGAAVMGALSAVDIALWDIAGKYYHVPVYRLLGGKCRDKVRVYNHTAGRTEEELIENAKRGVAEGYTALGHLNPYLDEPRDQPYADGNTAMLYKAERRIAKIREAVGEEVDLCLELHRRLEPGLAVQLSARLEPYNPMFLEDPVRPDNFDAMGEVAKKCRIPIATGERIHTAHEFEMLLSRGACSYVRVSLGVCGGFTGARKITAVAEAHHKSLVPHNPLSPVMTNAVLNFAAATEHCHLRISGPLRGVHGGPSDRQRCEAAPVRHGGPHSGDGGRVPARAGGGRNRHQPDPGYRGALPVPAAPDHDAVKHGRFHL